MFQYFQQFIFVLTSIFLIVNPIGAAPIYLMITEKEPLARRVRIAKKASLVSFGVLMLFLLFGTWILKLFGINIYSFKIAGGILLLLISINMLYKGNVSGTKGSDSETKKASIDKEDISVVPLAVPLLSGPGSIATVMVISGQYDTVLEKGISILAVTVTCFLIFYILRGAEKLMKLFGATGIKLANRLMGLILSAIAVQFLVDGIKTAVKLYK
jgi:multiple antibiotic resistance protein